MRDNSNDSSSLLGGYTHGTGYKIPKSDGTNEQCRGQRCSGETPDWVSDPRTSFLGSPVSLHLLLCPWATEGTCLNLREPSECSDRLQVGCARLVFRLRHVFTSLSPLCFARLAARSPRFPAGRLVWSAAALIDHLLSKPRAWDLVLLLPSMWGAVPKADELFLAQAALCEAGNSRFNAQIPGS